MFEIFKSKQSLIDHYENKLLKQKIELNEIKEKEIRAIELKHRTELNDQRIKMDADKQAALQEKEKQHSKDISIMRSNFDRELTIKTNEVAIEISKLERSQRKQNDLNIQLENETQRLRNISGAAQVVKSALIQHKENMDIDYAKIMIWIGKIENYEHMITSGGSAEPPIIQSEVKT